MAFIANKKFTGRLDHLKVLNDSIESLEHSERCFVKVFYGIGGQGKTSICNYFLNTVVVEQYKHKLIHALVDFNTSSNRAVDKCLLQTRKILAEKGRISFTAFDLAFYTYYKLTTKKENIQKEYPWLFLGENPILNKAVELSDTFISSVPGIGLIFNEAKKFVQNERESYLKTFDDILFDLDELTAQEIFERLPEYFAYDIKNHYDKKPQGRKIVITFDHYETLWENHSNKHGIGALNVDIWVRKLVDLLPKQLFILIFGRNKLDWQKLDVDIVKYGDHSLLEQHLVNSLSDSDADEFLRKIPIPEDVIRKKIIRSCMGVPFYLDRQVDIYTELKKDNKPIYSNSFGNNKQEIMVRYFAHLGDGQEDILSVLAVLQTVSYELFDYVRHEHFLPRFANFEKTVQDSFFEEQESGVFVMHALMREWLLDNLITKDKSLFLDINQSIFKHYDLKLRKLIETKHVDNRFDEFVFSAFYHLLAIGGSDVFSWTLEIFQLSQEFNRNTLWLQILQNAIEKCDNKRKSDIPDTTRMLLKYYYSALLQKFGRYKDGVHVAREMVKISKSLKNEEWTDLIISKYETFYVFAELLVDGERYDEAKRFLTTEFREKWLIKRLFENMDQHALAESVFWEIQQENMTAKFPYSSSIMANAAGNILFSQKRYLEAIPYYEKSLAENDDNNIMNLPIAKFCLGKAFLESSLIEKAFSYLSEANELISKNFRDNHPFALMAKRAMLKAVLYQENSYTSSETVEESLQFLFENGLKLNLFSTQLIEYAELVNLYYQRFEKQPKIFLYKFLLNSFSSRYGKYFAPLQPLINILQHHEVANATKYEQWVIDSINVNDYRIRVEGFKSTLITNEDKVNYSSWLQKHLSLPDLITDFELRKYELPFYRRYYLLEIFFTSNNPYSLYIITDGADIRWLNGRKEALSDLPKGEFLYKEESNGLYIRFCLDAVYGRFGPYILLEKKEDLEWSCANHLLEKDSEKLINLITPIKSFKIDNEGEHYKRVNVFFMNSLFNCDILLRENGTYELTNEELVMEGLDINYDLILPESETLQSLIAAYNNQLELLLEVINFEPEIYSILDGLEKAAKAAVELKSQPFSLQYLKTKVISAEQLTALTTVYGLPTEKITVYELPFCRKFMLVSLGHEAGTKYVFSDLEETIQITGDNSAFYTLAEKDFIFKEQEVISYIRLFFDFVKGKYGRFIILEDVVRYKIRSHSENMTDVIATEKLIQPLKFVEKRTEELIFASSAILFKDNIFSNTVHVKNDGTIVLTDDELLIEGMAVTLQEYSHYRELCDQYLLKLQKANNLINEQIEGLSAIERLIVRSYLNYYVLSIRERVEELYFY
jgi:hypothetical protein